MGGLKSVDEIEKLIEAAVKEGVKEALDNHMQLKKSRKSPKFDETEEMLYEYPGLIKTIEHINTLPKEAQVQLQNELIIAKHKIRFIDKALEKIKGDEFYGIIKDHYFDGGSNPADLAEKYYCHEATIRRQRYRLINKLAVLLFGFDALELD